MDEHHSEEDIKKVAKGAGITIVGSCTGKGIFFLSQVIISRWLGVEAFGLYALGLATVKICEIISRLGLNAGGMRFVSIFKDEDLGKLKGIILAASFISFLTGAVVGASVFCLSGWISTAVFSKPEFNETLRLFACGIPFLASMTVVTALLQGFHTTKYTVYVRDIIQPVANMGLSVLLLALGFGLVGVVVAFVVSHVLGLIAGLFSFSKLFPGFSQKDLKPDYVIKELVMYSLPLLFVGFLQYFLSNTDTLMLGYFGTSSDVGVYRAASQLPMVMVLFLFASNSVYAPLAADLYHKQETERLASIFKATTKWISYIVVPLFIIIIFSARDLMLIFGEEYVESGYRILIILAFGQLISCVTGGVLFTLIMTGKQHIEFYYEIALVILNIALNVLLIPKYGVIGAAIASSASSIAINVVRSMAVYFIYKMHPFFQGTAKYYFLSFLVSILLSGIHVVLPSKLQCPMNITVVCVVFGTFYMMMKKSSEDLILVNLVKAKISRLKK